MGWSKAKRKAAAARMKALNADPAFKAKMKALHADPWLASISEEEKRLYRKMCAAGVPWRSAHHQIDKAQLSKSSAG